MSADSTLIAQRYQRVERLGSGGMGEVWKARDVKFDSKLVALKLLREDDTHREDATNRERLQRLIRDEGTDGRLTVAFSAGLLDDALRVGKARDELRNRVLAKADGAGWLSADTVLSLFDELVGDPTFSESARIRAKLRRLFRDEANAVAKLQHPNIVSITDYGDHEGTPYLVMDYIEGQTLHRIIKSGSADRRTQLQLMEDLCAGLAEAHRHNLVHRDIKPANLIVERRTECLKILDFGVVRQLLETNESTMGLPVGTLCYMSPEQIIGSPTVDHRSDVFSVGSVFYELLSGEKAFPIGNGMSDLMARIQGSAPPPIKAYVPDLEDGILRILDRALEKNRDDRYQDLDEMRRDLARARRELDQTIAVPRPKAEPLIPRLLKQGDRALELGEPAAALECAAQILELDPTHSLALALRERALRLETQQKVDALLVQCQRCLEHGNYPEAREVWRSAVALDPSSQVAERLGRSLDQAEAAHAEEQRRVARADDLIRAAREHLDRREFSAAADAAREALSLIPLSESARALSLEAETGLADARAAQVREAERQAQFESLMADGRSALASGAFDRAIETFESAVRLAPDRDEAIRELEAARAAREEHAARTLNLVDTLILKGNIPDAEQLLKDDRTLHPAIAAKLREVEAERVRREQRVREEADLQRRVQDLLAAADAAASAGAFDQAIAHLRDATVIAPDRKDLAARITELERARDSAREREHNRRLVRDGLAQVRTFIEQEEFDRARAVLDSIEPLAPGDPGIVAGRAALASAARAREEARAEAERNRQAATVRRPVWAGRAKLVAAGLGAMIVAGSVVGYVLTHRHTGAIDDSSTGTTRGSGTGTTGGTAAGTGTDGTAAVGSLSVDLRPWANVKIVALDNPQAPPRRFVTPFVTSLPPGKYRLEAENGGITQPYQTEVEILPGQTRPVAEDMPGFSADRVVNELLGSTR